MFNSSIVNYQYFNRSSLNFLQKWWLDIDKVNFFFVLFLIILGVIMITSSSTAVAEKIDASKFMFIKKQLIFSLIAILILISISFLDNKKIISLAFLGMAISFLMMLYLPIFGFEAKGSRRWISIFGFSLQPSEFAKTFFVVINAYILCHFSQKKFLLNYGISFVLLFLLAILLVLQPDLGMTLIFISIWSIQLFLYGLPMVMVVLIGFFGVVGSIVAYLKFPHVKDRIDRFLDLDATNYQAEMSLDAYQSGSFFGVGPGAGMVKNHIPDAHTDFIFAVIAEEFGIISCIAILLLIFFVFSRIVSHAKKENDLFSYLTLCGLLMQFTLQVIVNVGVTLSLLPTKGMTLPFISYGGSSMLSMAICFGVILSLTKKRYHHQIDYGNTRLI